MPVHAAPLEWPRCLRRAPNRVEYPSEYVLVLFMFLLSRCSEHDVLCLVSVFVSSWYELSAKEGSDNLPPDSEATIVTKRLCNTLSFFCLFPFFSYKAEWLRRFSSFFLFAVMTTLIWCIESNHHALHDCLTYRLQRYLSESYDIHLVS